MVISYEGRYSGKTRLFPNRFRCWRPDFRNNNIHFYTPPHNSQSVRLSVSPTSVRPSIFRFRMITWVNRNGFSPNVVCALILWRSGLGLLMGKFRRILTELSARDTPIFLFQDDNLNKDQGILTKLGTCIDMKEIWFRIANGQISSMFDRVICPRHDWRGIIVYCFYLLRFLIVRYLNHSGKKKMCYWLMTMGR